MLALDLGRHSAGFKGPCFTFMFRAGDRRCCFGKYGWLACFSCFVLEGGVVGFAGSAFEGIADRVEAGFRL